MRHACALGPHRCGTKAAVASGIEGHKRRRSGGSAHPEGPGAGGSTWRPRADGTGPAPRPAARPPDQSRRGGAVPASHRGTGPRPQDPAQASGRGGRSRDHRGLPLGHPRLTTASWKVPPTAGPSSGDWSQHHGSITLRPAQGPPIARQPPDWPRAHQSQANTVGGIPSVGRTAGPQLLLQGPKRTGPRRDLTGKWPQLFRPPPEGLRGPAVPGRTRGRSPSRSTLSCLS